MRRIIILLALLNIQGIHAQDFDLSKSIQYAADSAFYNNAGWFRNYNRWDITTTHWFGVTAGMSNSTIDIKKASVIYIAPRGFSIGIQEWSSIPSFNSVSKNGALEVFRGNEIVANRSATTYVPTEFLSEEIFFNSFNAIIYLNSLNARILPPAKRKRERSLQRKEQYFENNSIGSAHRKRSLGKLFSVGVGLNFRKIVSYSLYTDNLVSNDYLTSNGFLLGEYSEYRTIDPILSIAFHPKYLVTQLLYFPSRNNYQLTIGVSFPIRLKR